MALNWIARGLAGVVALAAASAAQAQNFPVGAGQYIRYFANRRCTTAKGASPIDRSPPPVTERSRIPGSASQKCFRLFPSVFITFSL